VDVANNGVTSLDFLKNTTLLKEVDVSGNTELTDLSVLSRSAETLETVTLQYLTQADLSVLAACKNMKALDITACGTDDLSFVRDMRDLEILQAAGNRIHYMSPLFECRALKLINLAYNDISSLVGFPTAFSANYWYLYLQHNHLETLDGLTPSENGTVLAIQGNPLQNIDALQNTKVTDVILDYTPNLDTEVLNRSYRVYVTSVDLSEQVALEKAITAQLYLLNEEEALAKVGERYASIVQPIFP
jgi:Leucine-rich repeat (LRR) protein